MPLGKSGNLKNNKPVVTICIPVYNGAPTLEMAVKSVFKSKNPRLKVLIIDNASTDDTGKISLNLKKRYPGSLRYLKNETNLGFAGNYRRCLEEAEGYLFFIGVDDFLFAPEVIKLADTLDKNPTVDVVCSDLVQFTSDPLKPTRKIVSFGGQKREFDAGFDALTNWVLFSVLGSIGGYLIRSEVAKQYCQFLPKKSIIPQIFLGMMIASNNRVLHQPGLTIAQRLTDDESQLANKQYLSLDIISDHQKAIDFVTGNKFKSQVSDKKLAKQKLLDAYATGLVENIISYRCNANFRVYWRLIKLIPKYSFRQLFSIRYIVYLGTSLLVPRFILRKLLFNFRHRTLAT